MDLPARRTFLNRLTTGGLTLAGASLVRAGSAADPKSVKTLPGIQLGKNRVSRMIAGGNPIGGSSHNTARMGALMGEYFTLEHTIEFLLHCGEEGINAVSSGFNAKMEEALRTVRDRGCNMQWVVTAANRPMDEWGKIVALKPVAACHHGNITDNLFRAGKQDVIHDWIKQSHDRGVPFVGMSMHNPENMARAEDAGWETDMYMLCSYFLTRSREERLAMLNGNDVLGREVFFAADPARASAQIRQVRKPCLLFKILGDGRLTDNKQQVEGRFKFAFSNIKPTDSVIVGMCPVLFDEVAENCGFVRTHGKTA
jgi:hypothetical protein